MAEKCVVQKNKRSKTPCLVHSEVEINTMLF